MGNTDKNKYKCIDTGQRLKRTNLLWLISTVFYFSLWSLWLCSVRVSSPSWLI